MKAYTRIGLDIIEEELALLLASAFLGFLMLLVLYIGQGTPTK